MSKEEDIPKIILAGTDSLFIQKDTWERITVMMHGMYVWIIKYPTFLLRWKYTVMTTYSPNTQKNRDCLDLKCISTSFECLKNLALYWGKFVKYKNTINLEFQLVVTEPPD